CYKRPVPTELQSFSLHDALPISSLPRKGVRRGTGGLVANRTADGLRVGASMLPMRRGFTQTGMDRKVRNGVQRHSRYAREVDHSPLESAICMNRLLRRICAIVSISRLIAHMGRWRTYCRLQIPT